MIFHRLGLINKNQRGFTFIEIIIVIAIAGIITGGITTTIFQVLTGSARTNNHMTAVRQVQNAGYWVSLDAQMAQSIIFDDPATSGVTEFLTLTWTYWDSGEVNRVAYTFVNIPDSTLKDLQRIHTSGVATVETGIIARFIDPDLTTVEWRLTGGGGGGFSLPDKYDAFTITGGAVASSGTITVTAPGDVLTATPSGGATVAGSDTDPVTINKESGPVPWTTPAGGGQIIVERNESSAGLVGYWAAPTGDATAAITYDPNGNASIVGGGGKLIFTVTATVQEQSETRVYEVAPRPGS